MPAFMPFRGLRYDPRRVSLDDVIAPPYDVVGPEHRRRLAERSPYNSILVELPSAEPRQGLDPYQHAARLLEAWEGEGIVVRDKAPAFYGYRMTRRRADRVVSQTTGVIGAMAVDEEGSSVLPHEQTMARDTRDRLELLRACHANLSPIWGLSLAKGLSVACASAIGTADDHRQAIDDEGTTHEIWAVSDADAIDEITSVVGAAPVVIADGHHRYETALQFRSECRAANGDSPGGYDFIMTLVVELSRDELVVEPIHRLVSGLGGADLLAAVASDFRVEKGPEDPEAVVAAINQSGAIGLITSDGSYLMFERAAGARSGLDSARVDELLRGLPPHDLSYQAGAAEAIAAVRSGGAQAALIVKPATVEQIAAAADQRTTMPPKSTYFAPKPRTGMVFRPLDI